MIKNLFSFVEKFLNGQDRFYTVLGDKATFGSQSLWGSINNPLVDPVTQASTAGVFTPNYPITLVSGTNAITGLTVPYPDFQGTIILIPTAIWTWTAATNIAVAGTVTAANIPVAFTYVPNTGKWYASRLA